MDFNKTEIPGCYTINVFSHSDERGGFVKIFNEEAFGKKELDFHIREVYYSTSHKNVFRGFHFQTPPADHTKVVNCITGSVMDFILDLRVGSPTYHKCIALELNASENGAVYIPKGCAHGFLSLEDNTILSYMQETGYSPSNDNGILWSSVDIPYAIENPILSERDQKFPELQTFKSPFK